MLFALFRDVNQFMSAAKWIMDQSQSRQHLELLFVMSIEQSSLTANGIETMINVAHLLSISGKRRKANINSVKRDGE